MNVIRRGAVEILVDSSWKEKLRQAAQHNKPLRIKAGFDPDRAGPASRPHVLIQKLSSSRSWDTRSLSDR